MEIFLRDFNAKVGREDSFKPTIGNESLHENINDNGVRVVDFAASKKFTVKSTMCGNLSQRSRSRQYVYITVYHLQALFNQLQRYGIIINQAKYVFRASEVTFLGYKVSAVGSQPLEERVTHLQDCPAPKTVNQLR
jgi:hypothetical protein